MLEAEKLVVIINRGFQVYVRAKRGAAVLTGGSHLSCVLASQVLDFRYRSVHVGFVLLEPRSITLPRLTFSVVPRRPSTLLASATCHHLDLHTVRLLLL